MVAAKLHAVRPHERRLRIGHLTSGIRAERDHGVIADLDGRVYQQDPGSGTGSIARKMMASGPDLTWSRIAQSTSDPAYTVLDHKYVLAHVRAQQQVL